MMRSALLAAAAATAMLVAAPAITPAAAKDMKQSSATSKQVTHKKHRTHKHMSRMSHDRYDRSRSATYRDEWNRPMNTGFAPFDIAGNVVGGAIGTAGAIAGTAVGTAGAIAAAPFGGGPYGYDDAYAYDVDSDYAPDYSYNEPYRYDGTAMQYSSTYAARNGFVCQPGTWYKNSYGNQQICQ